MIKKDQIDRVMGMLREAKLAADADRRINYAHVCGRHRVFAITFKWPLGSDISSGEPERRKVGTNAISTIFNLSTPAGSLTMPMIC